MKLGDGGYALTSDNCKMVTNETLQSNKCDNLATFVKITLR